MSDLIDSLSRNLRGYWCPMIQYGGLTLRDQTRFKNNGTLTNMDASTDWIMSRVKGRSGRVLDFDGANDRVSMSVSTVDVRSLSISAWVLFTAIPGSSSVAEIIGKWGNNAAFDSTDAFVLSLGNLQGLRFFIGGPNAGVTTGSAAVATNVWYHLAAVWSQNTGRIFVDGVQQASGAIASSTMNAAAATEVRLGRSSSAAAIDVALSGRIAESALWLNRGLTLGEIQELYRIGPGWYQSQLPRRIPYSEQQAGFKAYWARQQSQLIGGGV